MTSVEELKKALKRERQHSVRLASDLAALRVENVQGQAEAEIHEEGRINALMRRLECLQREKGRIIVELEREEEMVRAFFLECSVCTFFWNNHFKNANWISKITHLSILVNCPCKKIANNFHSNKYQVHTLLCSAKSH